MIAHGYPLLFTIIALDCAFLPIPGELLLLTFGGIAVQAQFDLGIGIAVAALAVLVGDSISYWLGRFGGKRVMNKFRFAQGWTLGAPSVVFGRFVIGARVVVAPLAGARRMPFGRFLLFDAIGATLWAGLFVLIGYGARVNLAAVQQHWTGAANSKPRTPGSIETGSWRMRPSGAAVTVQSATTLSVAPDGSATTRSAAAGGATTPGEGPAHPASTRTARSNP